MALTPRQRWKGTFDATPIDRLATDYWGTNEFTAKLSAAVSGKNGNALWDALGIDHTGYVGPVHRPRTPLPPGVDMWGVGMTNIKYGTGEYAEYGTHPLAEVSTVRQIDDYPWPSVDDFDFTPIPQALAQDPGNRYILGPIYEPFLIYCALRGIEQAFMDFIENEDLAHAILGHLFEFHYELNRRCLEAAAGRIDLFYLAEDLGGQTGPLFSLETYRRFLLPGQQKMAALAHQHGAKVFYHTDGAARVFLPDLVEVVGIDLLNPLQWRCPGMELPSLVRDFAPYIVFHGGIDNQQTLVFGTPSEVRTQVREVWEIMHRHHARWICAPCHNIQPVSPAENALAMYDEAIRLPAPHQS